MNITLQTIAVLRTLVILWSLNKPRFKPEGYRQMLGIESDAKTVKGTAQGYLTGILYLAPHNLSGVINTPTGKFSKAGANVRRF